MAPPTILPCKNGNLFCGSIVRANLIANAHRRVQIALRAKRKTTPFGVAFLFWVVCPI